MESAEQPASLSFVQLSDLHLTTLVGVGWQDLLNKRILGYLSWRRRRRFEHRREVLDTLVQDLRRLRTEHVVITGDLTHLGLPEEFDEVRKWLNALGLPADITVIPGNHDAYVRTPWQSTYRQWLPYSESDGGGEHGNVADPQELYPSVRIRGPVAFIGLDSAVPAPWFMATGRLGSGQLDRLGEILEATKRRGLFRVVLIHHPPVPGEEKWRKRLIDAPALCRVIGAQGAELVLHGHRHRAIDSWIELSGMHIPVFGIPSASAVGRSGCPSQYYCFEVSKRDGRWNLGVQVRSYRTDSGQFVDKRGLQINIDS